MAWVLAASDSKFSITTESADRKGKKGGKDRLLMKGAFIGNSIIPHQVAKTSGFVSEGRVLPKASED
jgi:hypothetical protein